MLLQPDDHILFYGDSITDAGRDRNAGPNNPAGWGSGYAMMCAAQLQARYPTWNFSFSNKGISGNRVYDLEDRLIEDVLVQNPSLVSILIGINDTWRAYDSDVASPIAEFQTTYHRILKAISERCDARLVILEPFLLHTPADRARYREDLNPRIDAVREVAREFEAIFVPLDGIFAAAACRAPLEYWAPDGVHPSPAGHALIAQKWIEAVTGG